MLINQQRSIRDRHDIRNLIRRGADDRLQTHFAQRRTLSMMRSLSILLNASSNTTRRTVLPKLDYRSRDTAARTRPEPQYRTASASRRPTGVERLRQQLLGAVLIGGLQIELQIGAEVGVPLDVLLQLTLLAGVELGIVCMVIWLNSLSISGPYFS